MAVKLTTPQLKLLRTTAAQPSTFCAPHYQPRVKLQQLGLIEATMQAHNCYRITAAGRLRLQEEEHGNN